MIDIYGVLGLSRDCSTADIDAACRRRVMALDRAEAIELAAERLVADPAIREQVVKRQAELLSEWLTTREAAALARMHPKTFLRRVRQPEGRGVVCYDGLGTAVHRDAKGVLQLIPCNARWRRVEVNTWIASPAFSAIAQAA